MPISKFTLKDLTASKDSYYYIPLEAIKVEPGFNVRTDFGDIPGLAADIASNGLTQPLIVRLTSDKTSVILDDGERRYRAIHYINDNNLLPDGGIHDVKCILENKGTNEEARILKMFSTGANSKPLTEIEQAECVYRLSQTYHMSTKEIGKRIGRPTTYVTHLLELHSAPYPIREAVMAKKISHTAAVALSKASVASQTKVLKQKTKIKVKDVQHATRGTPFMISSKSIKEKIKLVEASKILIKKEIIIGLNYALGLWSLDDYPLLK